MTDDTHRLDDCGATVDLAPADAAAPFAVGAEVYKPRGHEFPGTVVAVFQNLAGETRYVVENALLRGWLHIFNGSQLAPAKPVHETDRHEPEPKGWCEHCGLVGGDCIVCKPKYPADPPAPPTPSPDCERLLRWLRTHGAALLTERCPQLTDAQQAKCVRYALTQGWVHYAGQKQLGRPMDETRLAITAAGVRALQPADRAGAVA